jgi:hypothetical protein
MAEIDAALLGFCRDLLHRFLLGDTTARAVRIDKAGVRKPRKKKPAGKR